MSRGGSGFWPVIDRGRRLGTAGFFPTVAKGGESQAASSDLTASSRLPRDIEKLSRAAATEASVARRSVTISESTEQRKNHAKLCVNEKNKNNKLLNEFHGWYICFKVN